MSSSHTSSMVMVWFTSGKPVCDIVWEHVQSWHFWQEDIIVTQNIVGRTIANFFMIWVLHFVNYLVLFLFYLQKWDQSTLTVCEMQMSKKFDSRLTVDADRNIPYQNSFSELAHFLITGFSILSNIALWKNCRNFHWPYWSLSGWLTFVWPKQMWAYPRVNSKDA